MNNIYYLGGSPCCGKSTKAEWNALVKEYVESGLNKHQQRAVAKLKKSVATAMSLR